MLIAKLVRDMIYTVVDIETSFLHGDLDEKIYTWKFLKGPTMNNNKKSIFRKTIYGLVKSTRKFYEKLIEVSKVIGFY
jgi:hypothetical protein